jgi:hypothetical protein
MLTHRALSAQYYHWVGGACAQSVLTMVSLEMGSRAHTKSIL